MPALIDLLLSWTDHRGVCWDTVLMFLVINYLPRLTNACGKSYRSFGELLPLTRGRNAVLMVLVIRPELPGIIL